MLSGVEGDQGSGVQRLLLIPGKCWRKWKRERKGDEERRKKNFRCCEQAKARCTLNVIIKDKRTKNYNQGVAGKRRARSTKERERERGKRGKRGKKKKSATRQSALHFKFDDKDKERRITHSVIVAGKRRARSTKEREEE